MNCEYNDSFCKFNNNNKLMDVRKFEVLTLTLCYKFNTLVSIYIYFWYHNHYPNMYR